MSTEVLSRPMATDGIEPTEFAMAEDFSGQRYVIPGGGTGTSSTAPGIANALPGAELVFAIGTADSGGGTGLDRRQFHAPGFGDGREVQKTLARNAAGDVYGQKFKAGTTLEEAQASVVDLYERVKGYGIDGNMDKLRTLMTVRNKMLPMIDRESRLGVQGRTLGSLAMIAAMYEGADAGEAFRRTNGWLDIDPRISVLPTSLDNHHIHMKDAGVVHHTEGNIDELKIVNPLKVKMWTSVVGESRQARIYDEVAEAIRTADGILIPPASQQSSLGAFGALEGASDALHDGRKAGGFLAHAANMMIGRDTSGLDMLGYEKSTGRMLGEQLDFLVANNDASGLPHDANLLLYDESLQSKMRAQLIGAALLSMVEEGAESGDLIPELRSGIRTDGLAFVQALKREGVIAASVRLAA